VARNFLRLSFNIDFLPMASGLIALSYREGLHGLVC
jgi:hypothetical protein